MELYELQSAQPMWQSVTLVYSGLWPVKLTLTLTQ